MPNVQTVLKEEIARVARKEIKSAVGKLKEDNIALKRSVTALKRELASQEAELKRVRKLIGKSAAAATTAKTGDEQSEGRFWVTSNGIKSLRKKLRLTQAEFAELLGVSGQAVYQWEAKSGQLKVRSKTREAIIDIRKLGGAKEAQAKLVEQRTENPCVPGSNPGLATIFPPTFSRSFFGSHLPTAL